MCVTNDHYRNRHCPKPEVLTTYNVVDRLTLTDGVYYHLAEFPPQQVNDQWQYYFYHSKGFAVLPERSADEMGEEREAIVNIETQPA